MDVINVEIRWSALIRTSDLGAPGLIPEGGGIMVWFYGTTGLATRILPCHDFGATAVLTIAGIIGRGGPALLLERQPSRGALGMVTDPARDVQPTVQIPWTFKWAKRPTFGRILADDDAFLARTKRALQFIQATRIAFGTVVTPNIDNGGLAAALVDAMVPFYETLGITDGDQQEALFGYAGFLARSNYRLEHTGDLTGRLAASMFLERILPDGVIMGEPIVEGEDPDVRASARDRIRLRRFERGLA